MDIATDGPTLILSGDFDVRSTWQVRQAIYDHLDAQGEGTISIDMTQVDHADVAALKVLAFATRQAGRSGQTLMLKGCGPAVRRLLHISRLIRVVELEREVATA